MSIQSRTLVEHADDHDGRSRRHVTRRRMTYRPFRRRKWPKARRSRRSTRPAWPRCSTATASADEAQPAPARPPRRTRGWGSVYTQVTSPLRRYLDLVVRRQLAAHLDAAAFGGMAAAPRHRRWKPTSLAGSVRSSRYWATCGPPSRSRTGTGRWSICSTTATGAARASWWSPRAADGGHHPGAGDGARRSIAPDPPPLA